LLIPHAIKRRAAGFTPAVFCGQCGERECAETAAGLAEEIAA